MKTLLLGLAMTATMLATTACDPDLKGNVRPRITDLAVKLPDPDPRPTSECPSPRPPNLGCTTLCKPCRVAICESGQWTYEDIDWGEICKPSSPTPPTACPRGDNGFCPAECSICT